MEAPTGRLTRLELRLRGAGGEPVDLRRTINSHGLVDLPPMRLADDSRALEVTLPLGRGRPRTVRIAEGRRGYVAVTVSGPKPSPGQRQRIKAGVARTLRLDEDLSEFYGLVVEDAELSWAAAGAGRLVRNPSVFEEVVKTICTTNCAWSATERMVGALVEHLGEPAPDAPPQGPWGRAFPTAAAMASADAEFYRDVARTGYRGDYLRSLAAAVAAGTLDLESLAAAGRDELPDEELALRLLALPGVGPYAAAHIMMMLGRYSPLILDSWTRPTYARLNRGRTVKDATIQRRFRRYGPWAGLAFWLVLTRDWVEG